MDNFENISNSKKKVSLLIPFFNESIVFNAVKTAIKGLIEKLEGEYALEIILIDDGSTDDTWDKIVLFSGEEASVKAVKLSRNFGHQSAISCGYKLATGDAVISMDGDLQDPPELCLEMIKEWEGGADIVYAVRRKRTGDKKAKLFLAKLFYKTLHLLGLKFINRDTGDFRLMSRRSVIALNNMPESDRFIRGMVGWLGFNTKNVHFDRQERAGGEPKYTFIKSLKLAVNGIISFTSIPLKFAYLISSLLFGGLIIYLLYAFIGGLTGSIKLEAGWTSIILTMVFLGGVQLFCLGIMGHYVHRIYSQVKQRPIFIVQEMVGGSNMNQSSTVSLKENQIIYHEG